MVVAAAVFGSCHALPLPLATVVVWRNSGVALAMLRVAAGDACRAAVL